MGSWIRFKNLKTTAEDHVMFSSNDYVDKEKIDAEKFK